MFILRMQQVKKAIKNRVSYKTFKFCKNTGMVRETGLEPVWYYHTHLKRARLPIPPLSHMVEEDGFEPSKSVTTDLQSAPFGRSGTPPGAGDRTWTYNLLITNQLLCQLSYTSKLNFPPRQAIQPPWHAYYNSTYMGACQHFFFKKTNFLYKFQKDLSSYAS